MENPNEEDAEIQIFQNGNLTINGNNISINANGNEVFQVSTDIDIEEDEQFIISGVSADDIDMRADFNFTNQNDKNKCHDGTNPYSSLK